MRRLVSSRAVFALTLLLIVTAVAAAVWQLQGAVASLSERSAFTTAHLLADISVNRAARAGVNANRQMTAVERAGLDSDVAALTREGRLAGLELWAADGHLIYADRLHPADETRLPAGELARASTGTTWLQPDDQARGATPVFDVFVPYDSNDDGAVEAVVEVLIPRDQVTAQARRYTTVLLGLALLLTVGAIATLARVRAGTIARERLARVDPLTGLPNRTGLRFELVRAAGDRAALLVLDVNGFRAVNETLGYLAGDALLGQVGRALVAAVRPGDLVGRLSGDEFAVLLADLPAEADGSVLGRQIVERLQRESFAVAGVDVGVDLSTGIALYPEHGSSADELLQHAEIALHEAKSRSAGVAVFDPASGSRDVERLALLSQLRRAVDEGELVLHYQPKARLGPGHLAGVEALVRWQHPVHGLLSPDRFIPLAENTGLIHPLTRWVLEEAVRQARRWRDAGLMLPVAVNISPRTLLFDDLPATLVDVLAAEGVTVDLIELEITESSVLTDPERAIQVCRRLNATGARISIDDFGAGYTSLSYLKRLPVTTLKIDRSFVTDMLTDPKDLAIVQSVVELGKRLGLTVLAEGIENQAVWDRLAELGCDEGQGYHLARPMPAADVMPWVAARLAASVPGQRRPAATASTDGSPPST